MLVSRLLFRIALLLLPVALTGTTWLYLYPVFHGCAFPTPPSSHAHPVAPFRLLSLGDPQLEGDSSLPDPHALVFPSIEYLIPHLRDAATLAERRDIAAQAAKGLIRDARRWLEGRRKAIDLWGNDWYLAHIVRSLRWWTKPTHISVLGDLLGSQWVTDGEFRKRAGRYWNIVMRGLENVPQYAFGVEGTDNTGDIPADTAQHGFSDADKEGRDVEEEIGEKATESGLVEEAAQAEIRVEAADQDDQDQVSNHENREAVSTSKPERRKMWGGTTEILGADQTWDRRVINIAGNHDVGYAGDIDESRIERFERAFGSVNWDIWFTLPQHARANTTADPSIRSSVMPDAPPAIRIVVLNSMNLDTPAWAPDLQSETYSFVNHIITTSRPVTDKTHATVLLTHIPLEKESGVCVDSPYFDFFDGGHGVKEQNMLSDHSSKIVFEGIFGMSGNKDAAGDGLGRRGIVMNGHDHAGCDVVHYIRQPGIGNQCRVDDVKSEEAYWPVSITLDESMLTSTVAADADADADADNGDALPSDESASETFLHDNETEMPSAPAADHDLTIATSESDSLPRWRARRFPHLPYDINAKNECMAIGEAPHIREITLRSMMGEYSGYAGFLSAWFDETIGDKGEWVFEFSTCSLGVQHWWWGVHIVDLILIVCVVAGIVIRFVESITPQQQSSRKGKGAEDLSLSKTGRNSMQDTKCMPRTVASSREAIPTTTK